MAKKISMKAISMKVKLSIGKDVVSRQVKNEEVILNLATGTYFGLDQVGTFIWQKIKADTALEQIYQDLLEEYQAEPERIKKDLLALTQRLQKSQLIHVR